MSFPRKLHILIIEDDSDTVAGYRTWFEKTASKEFSIVGPVYARSFSDALDRIRSSEVIHVVILDMNLPVEARADPVEGLAPGEQLLEAIAKRDSHPVPVLLVVSGKLNLAQPLSGVQERLTSDFWHGALINKGPEQYKEITEGLRQALRYVDVGIHIRDAGREWFPTISPREEYLLRRCVLAQSSCLGLDLRWWSAENGPSFSHLTPNAGPTKVLMGHFLLDEGLGTSLPTFFKLEPSGNGPHVCRDASILAHKLGHVKVLYTLHARDRSLIVTQSVTNQGWPISLNEYFRGDPKVVAPSLPRLIDQVVCQLDQLGALEDDEIPVGDFLWKWLDLKAIDKTWNACDTRELREGHFSNPLTIYHALKQSAAKHWSPRRRCTHGDLNATNIAINASDPAEPQAYIFDAAGVRADFECRDLATLEVTSILFNSVDADDLLPSSEIFYGGEFAPSPDGYCTASPFTRNVLAGIHAIRGRFRDEGTKVAYALLLFNAALQQLSGLGLQSSPNKVRNPVHACHLAAWIARMAQTARPSVLYCRRASPGSTAANSLNRAGHREGIRHRPRVVPEVWRHAVTCLRAPRQRVGLSHAEKAQFSEAERPCRV